MGTHEPMAWEVAMDSVSMEGYNLTIRSNRAAIGTGTSLIAVCLSSNARLLPRTHLRLTRGATPGVKGQYTIDCERVASFPDITMVFGGRDFVMKGSDYIVELAGSCVSSFFGIDLPPSLIGLWIVGDAFLRKIF
jgi:saccharopepsin